MNVVRSQPSPEAPGYGKAKEKSAEREENGK